VTGPLVDLTVAAMVFHTVSGLLLSSVIAVAAMNCSSVSVAGNVLRLFSAGI